MQEFYIAAERAEMRSAMTLYGSLKSQLRNSCVNQYLNEIYAESGCNRDDSSKNIPTIGDVNAIKNRQLQFAHFPLSSFAALLSLPPPSRHRFSFLRSVWTFSFAFAVVFLCNADKKKSPRESDKSSLSTKKRRQKQLVFCKYISKLKWIYKIEFAFLLIFHKASRRLVVNRIHSVELARLPRVRRITTKKEFFVFANNYRIYTISVAIFVKKIRYILMLLVRGWKFFYEVIICRSNTRNHRGSENSLKVSIQINLRIILLECK